jgi:hypothetical protein
MWQWKKIQEVLQRQRPNVDHKEIRAGSGITSNLAAFGRWHTTRGILSPEAMNHPRRHLD